MTNKTTIAERVRNVMAGEFAVDVSEIVEELEYNGIPEWDSVSHMHMVAALEDEFGVYFDDNVIGELSSLKRVVALVEKMTSDQPE